MDTTEQMSQLASFSQVEQQVKMNTNLSTLISQSMIGQAGNLIGKTVTDADGGTGTVKSINVATDSSTSAVTLIATLDSGSKMTIGPGSPSALRRAQAQASERPMNEADALDIVQAAIWTVIVSAGPAVGAAMVVGVVIALIQALTQVQEMTLTFVPKILAVMATVALSAPFIGAQISIFTNMIFSRIQSGF